MLRTTQILLCLMTFSSIAAHAGSARPKIGWILPEQFQALPGSGEEPTFRRTFGLSGEDAGNWSERLVVISVEPPESGATARAIVESFAAEIRARCPANHESMLPLEDDGGGTIAVMTWK